MSVTKYQRNFEKCFPFSNTSINILLAANTAVSYTVPGTESTIYRAHFSVSTSADVWVRLNEAAQVPTSGTVASTTNMERIDVDFQRYVKGGDTLSFISTTTPQVGVSLLQVQDIT